MPGLVVTSNLATQVRACLRIFFSVSLGLSWNRKDAKEQQVLLEQEMQVATVCLRSKSPSYPHIQLKASSQAPPLDHNPPNRRFARHPTHPL